MHHRQSTARPSRSKARAVRLCAKRKCAKTFVASYARTHVVCAGGKRVKAPIVVVIIAVVVVVVVVVVRRRCLRVVHAARQRQYQQLAASRNSQSARSSRRDS